MQLRSKNWTVPEELLRCQPMKIVRFENESGQIALGAQQPDGRVTRIEGDLFGEFRDSGEPVSVAKILMPIVPTSILCIGLNYRKHAEETNAPFPKFPILFTKGLGAAQNPNDPILIPTHLASHQVDYECELAIVIGKKAKNVTRENALDHVLGYTCANDVSARDWQKQFGGSQWSRGKFFDTFCPLGPVLVTTDEIPNPNSLAIRTILNGEVVQESNTSDMIFDVPALIEFLSGSTTLFPGTVILTGTPSGVGMARNPPRWLKPGDEVIIDIEKIGQLRNPIALEVA